MMLADAGAMKSRGNIQMRVPKGSSVSISFPVRPQIVNMGGSIVVSRGGEWKIEMGALTTLGETAQCAAVQVVSMHNSVCFIGGDGSVWGMGYRA